MANASHELRTPLTAERTLLQVALDDPDTTTEEWRSTAREVLASSDEQAGLIEALLTLASSESGLCRRGSVDLAGAVDVALVDLEPDVDRLGLRVDAVTMPAHLEGDQLLIERLVANLLENAVTHNVADGHIEVVTSEQEGQAVISVVNSGPGIAPEDVDRLFEPFQRLEEGRSHHKEGHGLGLSIVRAIATAHRATIRARPSADGGLSVSVVFAHPADADAVSEPWQPDDTHRLEVISATP